MKHEDILKLGKIVNLGFKMGLIDGKRSKNHMTLKERVIVEVYTGVVMVTGEDRKEVYSYASRLMGRPVMIHEWNDKQFTETLREKSKEDFISLCRGTNCTGCRYRVPGGSYKCSHCCRKERVDFYEPII